MPARGQGNIAMTGPRVAIVCDWYLPRFGGIELHLHNLAVRLREAGADLEVLTAVPGPGEIDGVRVHRLCESGSPKGGYLFPPPPQAHSGRDLFFFLEAMFRPGGRSAAARLREQLRAGGYDAVHVHFGNAPLSFVAVREALRLDIPVLTTFHSVIAHLQVPVAMAMGRLFGCARWPVRHSAVSGVVARSLRPLLGDAPVETLPNGIDAEWWGAARALRRERNKDRPIELLSVMRLHARKRPRALLRAFAAALRHMDGARPARLRIVGDGPLGNRLQGLVSRLGLDGQVELCGQKGREEIRDMLARADLFVMPSLLESFGIAALEARSAGVPVLAMEGAGLRDFLAPGKDALLASDDDALARALQRFLDDGELRRRLAEACADPVPGYSWPEIVSRHIEAYGALARASRAPAVRET